MKTLREYIELIENAEQVTEWGYSPPRNIKREIEYEKKQKEKMDAYRAANPVEPKPTNTLARLKRIPGFNKVSPEEQHRVATAVDGYLERGMTFDQALVLAQKTPIEEDAAEDVAKLAKEMRK